MHVARHGAASAISTVTIQRYGRDDAGGRDLRLAGLLFGATVAAYLVYAALFIYRTSFVIDGERYFSLFDDAMVSMRYARNLAEGYGLVWNPGAEAVEGYTNPLWVLFMSVFHLLPLSQSKVSLAVQITAAILLALNLVFVRRAALAVSGGSTPVAWGAVALTAFYLPINFWSLQGMEVSVLVLLMTACTVLAMQCLDTGAFHRSLYVLLGIGTLVRPDMVVPLLAFASYLFLADSVNRRRHVRWGVLVLVAAVGAQTAFRLAYYGDVLPNTYYLKMTGVPLDVRITRGIYVLLQFVWNANPLLFLLAGTLALLGDRRIWLLLWILTGQVAYSVYVGGDAWEYWGGSNRYISIAMPSFFALLSYALYLVVSAFAGVLRADGPDVRTLLPVRPSWLFALALAYAAACLNSIHGVGALAEAALIRPVLHTGSGAGNQRDVSQSLLLRRATTADASIAVMRAGTIPYFSERPAVDLLGKNDTHVAHGPVAVAAITFQDFRPGHMKFDFAHSIGDLQPDVIVQLRRRTEQAQPYLAGYQDFLLDGNCIWVRRESPRIIWNQLSAAPGCPASEPSADD
jgi:hypothetical protein